MQVFVSFPEEEKVGMKTTRSLQSAWMSEEDDRAVLVTQDSPYQCSHNP